MKKNRPLAAIVVAGMVFSTILASKAGYSVPTNGLIGYWPGNGTAADASSVSNNGSFGGSYSSGPTGGEAFNLGTAKVTIPNNSAYNFTSYEGWSVGFWFNGNGADINYNNGLFLGQDNGPGFNPKWFIDYGYTVYVGNNDWYNFHVNDYNEERYFLSSQGEPSPTGWNQLTVTIDNTAGGMVDFYLNGQSIGTTPMPSYVLETTAPLVFGYAESGLSYNGLMSDVVIYDRVLSTNEVQQLATAPFSVTNEYLDGLGNIVITWQSQSNFIYQVVDTTNLTPPISWVNAGSPVVATNTSTSATIPITSSMNFLEVASP
jgi:hypothetical protein